MQKRNYRLTILLLAHNEEKTIIQEIKKIQLLLNKIRKLLTVVIIE